jgi:Uma2 family endonuclease
MKSEDGSPQMTSEEFLSWGSTSGTEWVDGQTQPLPIDPWHCHELRGFLTWLLRTFAEEKEVGIVIPAPFPMYLGQESPIRMPDLMFIAREHLERLRETYVDGPADIVIEIVSSESGPRDRGEKFYEYEAAGVYEYWLIDPGRHQAEFYRLDSEGHYQWVLPDPTGVFRSEALPDFSLKIEWLWQESRPTLMAILRELRLL